MRHSRKAMAAIMAGTMLAGQLAAPAAALAEEITATGATPVTIVMRNDATVTDGDKGKALASNVRVKVPTSIPLAADRDGKVTGPTQAGFTNLGSLDAEVASVGVELAGGFSALKEGEAPTGRANEAYVRVARAAKPGEDKTSFTLADKTKEFEGWELPANMASPDLVAVDAESRLHNASDDLLDQARPIATLNWTLRADNGVLCTLPCESVKDEDGSTHDLVLSADILWAALRDRFDAENVKNMIENLWARQQEPEYEGTSVTYDDLEIFTLRAVATDSDGTAEGRLKAEATSESSAKFEFAFGDSDDPWYLEFFVGVETVETDEEFSISQIVVEEPKVSDASGRALPSRGLSQIYLYLPEQ